jgi:hypothetical protein
LNHGPGGQVSRARTVLAAGVGVLLAISGFLAIGFLSLSPCPPEVNPGPGGPVCQTIPEDLLWRTLVLPVVAVVVLACSAAVRQRTGDVRRARFAGLVWMGAAAFFWASLACDLTLGFLFESAD